MLQSMKFFICFSGSSFSGPGTDSAAALKVNKNFYFNKAAKKALYLVLQCFTEPPPIRF